MISLVCSQPVVFYALVDRLCHGKMPGPSCHRYFDGTVRGQCYLGMEVYLIINTWLTF